MYKRKIIKDVEKNIEKIFTQCLHEGLMASALKALELKMRIYGLYHTGHLNSPEIWTEKDIKKIICFFEKKKNNKEKS